MKKTLSLDLLKVKSFITDIRHEHVDTVKGGRPPESFKCASDFCPIDDTTGGPSEFTANFCSVGYECRTNICDISTNDLTG